MRTLAAVMIAVLAAALVLAADSPAMAAKAPPTITIKAAAIKPFVPAVAKCPVLAAGKPVTITVNAATIKTYAPALAKLFSGGKSLTVTIKP